MGHPSNNNGRYADDPLATTPAAQRAREIGRSIAAAGEKAARGGANSPFAPPARRACINP
jgi:hypothetical protein